MSKLFPSFLAGDRPNVVAITSRFLLPDEDAFFHQVERIAASGVDAFILREKDLSHEEYLSLARRFCGICASAGCPAIMHSDIEAARKLGIMRVQLPLPLLVDIHTSDKSLLEGLQVGTSVHSHEDALLTRELPVSWLIASNIFPTDCKKGLPGRGFGFLEDMRTTRPDIPLIGLGGIDEENAADVLAHGADGVALMSGFMRCDDPDTLVRQLRGHHSRTES
ncbi:MAG: thiamine phosphate synthase [Actinomycetota bacterium]|nr:thiamine phosphate synthase [Actinomycetota bacterium]